MADPAPQTYTNPVYSGSFPDPFVLKHDDQYFAFCTGHSNDGRVFGVLNSHDLVMWNELPGAMQPLPDGVAAGDLYWAPEVTHHDGTFYLYYSVGNEKLMEIRVATAAQPAGPYVDAGYTLTKQDFAIDPHIFKDDDGSWHMFYATDFLEYSHIGTGTVVDRMSDPFTLAGDPRPVTRAKYDWQVYDPARKEKGGVRWHTVEGPFVLKRKGKYFEMFSGGNWQNITYGVGYAVADRLNGDDEWTQQVDGIDTLPLLHTIPGKVIGPGHNSVVTGPNGRELYCVYHRWEDGKRVMCIDRMDFAGGDRLFVVGPTSEPQPAPFLSSTGGFEETFAEPDVAARGWSLIGGSAELANGPLLVLKGDPEAFITREAPRGDFELAVNLQLVDILGDGPCLSFGCGVLGTMHMAVDTWRLDVGDHVLALPGGFDPADFHQFRMLKRNGTLHIYVDGLELEHCRSSGNGGRVEVLVRQATAALDMVRFTHF